MYATLIYELFNVRFNDTSDFGTRGKVPINLFKYIRRFSNTDPQQRASLSILISEKVDFFMNDFVEMNLFLENIAIKDQPEKDDFLKYS